MRPLACVWGRNRLFLTIIVLQIIEEAAHELGYAAVGGLVNIGVVG